MMLLVDVDRKCSWTQTFARHCIYKCIMHLPRGFILTKPIVIAIKLFFKSHLSKMGRGYVRSIIYIYLDYA